MSPAESITVLHSLAPPDGTTRYVDQMTDGAPDDVHVTYFSWRRALTGRYDVLHLHWPEFLLRGRTRRQRLRRRLAMRGTLLRARLTRTPIVRTAHNIAPHEDGSHAEMQLLRAVDRATTTWIRLNDATPLADGAHGTTILHGHYRDRFAAHPRRERVDGRVLYFGIIRPRKNVEQLIDVFTRRDRPGSHLRIVGSPTPELAERITARVDGRDDVSARLAFVDDDELVAEVSAATLVVLPYAEMHNSGAALVALSLDRPVLVPRSDANTALAAEVGPGWVRQFDGALDEDDLTTALAAAAEIDPAARPRLEGRDWDEVGRRHRDVYREAMARARGGRR
ncbi:MAG: GDP-mannose--glycolipid 4-beta-D-mannosyltransferase [Actinobacteria bacterium]|nr:GDP-mannose--glycolipid 4-beta-D-mannosyltransferase [Actinomycetota bacterium]